MRITEKFIFIHLPKTGGSWIRDALLKAHTKIFYKNSLMGNILLIVIKVIPWLKKKLSSYVRALVIFDYEPKEINHFAPAFFHRPPYPRRSIIKFLLKIANLSGLYKETKSIVAFWDHTRRSQLPKTLASIPIVSSIRDPFSWHVSRFNYYKKQDVDNLHARDIMKVVGKYDDFNYYCEHQMLKTQDIYYRSYCAAMTANNLTDTYQYPIDVFPWLKLSPQHLTSPKHIGLFSFLFIWFFFPNPLYIMNLKENEYLHYFSSGKYKKELKNIIFLPLAKINQDFYNFLLNNGYADKNISFIKNMAAQNVSTQGDYYKYYKSTAQLNRIYYLEKIIFIIFPQYEKIYQEYQENR